MLANAHDQLSGVGALAVDLAKQGVCGRAAGTSLRGEELYENCSRLGLSVCRF
jgi:hypothetical protein